MKKIQKQYINKARTFEKKIAKEKWNKLREIIRESGVSVKIDREHEMWLNVAPNSNAEIELYPYRLLNGEFVHIKIWSYQFKSEILKERYFGSDRNQRDISGIPEALLYINRILEDIRFDIKNGNHFF
ncbi:hypothetical protein BJG88_10780 [Staphylococcus nepalensis]|uniref:hypothetical protein n=1 Tax=Staphylococcus nepalensis TaxID=214473 RepID=UPI000D58AD2C|nr:hypothetical protein [Staphylococcus nepalensis]AWI45191.1 hypothetical protein BJG88_10780 [Staphylococcus nepalensis]